MKCEICQKEAATVHLTDVSNNSKKEMHLCESCAQERGATIKSHMHKEPAYPEFKPHELMTVSTKLRETPLGARLRSQSGALRLS